MLSSTTPPKQVMFVFALVTLLLLSSTAANPFYSPSVQWYEHDVAEYAKYAQSLLPSDETAFAISVATKQAQNILEFDTASPFTTQQAPPSCRKFNDEADQANAAVDSQSICRLVLQDKFVMVSDAGVQAGTAYALYQLYMGVGDPQTGCDLALFTYLCNFSYASCREEVDPADTTQTVQIPAIPCETYRDEHIIAKCPVIFGAGLDAVLFSPVGPTGEPMTWFAPEPTCQVGLTPTPRTVPDAASGSGVSVAMLPYTCPSPLVNVDAETYPNARFLNGPCAVPCPGPINSPDEYASLNKFMMGWSIPSQIMGIFLVVSYLLFTPLRRRRFIVLAVLSVTIQGVFTFYPFAASISREGWTGGYGAVCSGPASEYHYTNFLCTLTAFIGVFGMFTSLTAVNALGVQLVQRVCFQTWFQQHMDERRRKLQEKIFIGASLVIPFVFAVVALSYHQMDGNSGSVVCSVCKARDVTHGPNLSDGLGLIASVPFVIFAYIELFAVIGYLFYMRSVVKSSTLSLTGAQIRIALLIAVMTSLYIGMYAFRLDMEYNIKPKLEASIGEFLVCLILTGPDNASASCGLRPAYTIPMGWRRYITWIQSTPSFTMFFAIGFSFDLLYCWAQFIYYYTKWSCLRPYAKKAPQVQSTYGGARTRKMQIAANESPDDGGFGVPTSALGSKGSHGSKHQGDVSTLSTHVQTQAANKKTQLFKRSQHYQPKNSPSNHECGIDMSTLSSVDSVKLSGLDDRGSGQQSPSHETAAALTPNIDATATPHTDPLDTNKDDTAGGDSNLDNFRLSADDALVSRIDPVDQGEHYTIDTSHGSAVTDQQAEPGNVPGDVQDSKSVDDTAPKESHLQDDQHIDQSTSRENNETAE